MPRAGLHPQTLPLAPISLAIMSDQTPSKRRRKRYAPDDEIERVLHIVRKNGFTPARVTLDADGGITVFDRTGSEDSPPDAAAKAMAERRRRKAAAGR
jgi:hypothetical protein